VDGLTFISSLVGSLAWPLAVVVLAILFKRQIADLIARLRTVKALGAEGTFDPKEAEASVALATAATAAEAQAATGKPVTEHAATGKPVTEHPATDVTVQYATPNAREITERLMDLAQRSPQAAVLEGYAEIERILKRRMNAANVAGIEKLFGQGLVDVALRKGVITSSIAVALRDLVRLRNVAAHEPDEVSLPKAIDFLALADSVAYSIETWATFGYTATTRSYETTRDPGGDY
jgi:hypothetical protein